MPPIGSLVVPSPRYRDSMSTGEGAALLLGVRRSSGHLFYPGTDREYWVPTRQIGPIPANAVPPGTLENFLSELLMFLRTEECTLLSYGDGRAELEITYPGMDRNRLLGMVSMLGDRLADYSIKPGSMQVALLRLALQNLPDPAPAIASDSPSPRPDSPKGPDVALDSPYNLERLGEKGTEREV
jgi:hypothetical protein